MRHTYAESFDRALTLIFVALSAMLALFLIASSISWLTDSVVYDIALFLTMWSATAIALSLVFSVLSWLFGRWLSSLATKVDRAPDEQASAAMPGASDGRTVSGAEHDPSEVNEWPAITVPMHRAMLLQYLALRTTLQWHYRANPYEGDIANQYAPTELILSRHTREKLEAYADFHSTSLSDAAERMILHGLADDHLAHLVREGQWMEWEEESK